MPLYLIMAVSFESVLHGAEGRIYKTSAVLLSALALSGCTVNQPTKKPGSATFKRPVTERELRLERQAKVLMRDFAARILELSRREGIRGSLLRHGSWQQISVPQDPLPGETDDAMGLTVLDTVGKGFVDISGDDYNFVVGRSSRPQRGWSVSADYDLEHGRYLSCEFNSRPLNGGAVAAGFEGKPLMTGHALRILARDANHVLTQQENGQSLIRPALPHLHGCRHVAL